MAPRTRWFVLTVSTPLVLLVTVGGLIGEPKAAPQKSLPDLRVFYDVVGLVMQAYVDFVRADPKAYRLMFDGDHHELRDYPELQRASLRAKATMSRHIVGMIEAGLLPAETDAAMLGFVLWSQLHGAVMLHLAGKLNNEAMFAIVEEATRLVLRGAGLKIKVKAEAA